MDSALSLVSTEIAQAKTLTSQLAPVMEVSQKQSRLGKIEKWLAWKIIRLRIAYLTFLILKSPGKIYHMFKTVDKQRSKIWAGNLKKMHKVDGKYYFNLYNVGYPSKLFDDFVRKEVSRNFEAHPPQPLAFVFFAITRKCPLQCEHCFEWNNLNKQEAFTREEMLQTVDFYQKQGAMQFHFSGGEPMVRIKDLLAVIEHASKKSECWVLTSGFNVNAENAQLLKSVGCTGMAVSMDHYIPELHNIFRGSIRAFDDAVNAVRCAQSAGLVTTLSICATRHFIDGGHLLPYIEFANDLGVQFIQVLEPKNVGNYADKDVLLEQKHVDELEKVFKLINHHKAYQRYPTLIYHGYHQRRLGCFNSSRSLYIDSIGDVHACPFCHTKSYNILQILRKQEKAIHQKSDCPRYENLSHQQKN